MSKIHSVLRSKLRTDLICAACGAVLIAIQPAHALQILEATDGATIYGKVSIQEPTRIALDAGRIASMRVKDGTLYIDPDDESGQIFVSVPEGMKKPINGFLTTDSGKTVTLVLQPTDIPAETIILKSPKARRASQSNDLFRSTTYDKAVKRLVVAMANDELPDDIDVREVGERFSLWKEADMTLERQYSLDTVVGEKFRVVNVSKDTLTMEEREFYRKGVHVVAIDLLNLAPGASTFVYVIRERTANE